MSQTLWKSYVAGLDTATSLFGSHYRDGNALSALASNFANRSFNPQLIATLRKQNSVLEQSPARTENLNALDGPGTLSVVTGQQCGLFTGPLFTCYKILTAIATARSVEQKTGRKTIPIFWVQSEDHDLLEVDHCSILAANGAVQPLSLRSDENAHTNNRTSVAHLPLGSDVIQLLEVAEKTVQDLPHAASTLEIFRQSYQADKTYSEALFTSLGEIFAEEGLLLFDPRGAETSSLLQGIFERAFDNFGSIEDLLNAQGRKIEEQGFTPTVHVRSNSPLFFVHPHGLAGPRYRLERDANEWRLAGTGETLSQEQIENFVHSAPEQLSSSALLRPLLQDSLFPTVAYIAGPSELEYWAQITPLYELFDLHKPLVIPRASFVLLEPKIVALLEKLQLSVADLALPSQQLLERLSNNREDDLRAPAELERLANTHLENLFSEIKGDILRADQTLEKPLNKTLERMRGQIESLQARYAKALATRDTITTERVERILNNVRPNGREQERELSPLYYFAQYGLPLKQTLLSRIDPFAEIDTENYRPTEVEL